MRPGDTVDRYTVVETLGEGGMASVYGVRHTTLGTPHALKVLNLEGADIRDRLVQEGRVQALLEHPHIVAVTDVLDVDGSPGLLMEYVEGATLDLWLANHRPSVDEALAVFRGVLAAVAHAHEKGVVHRDLKPGNVLLAIGPNGAIAPKVMDFGLAKSFVRKLRQGRTRDGAVMGTPAYMPPEQIRDASKVDRRADIYALGCILYELLCGEKAFAKTDRVELFKDIGAGVHVPIGERVPDLPLGVTEAVESMMCHDRKYRLSDCAMVLEVLAAEGAALEVITAITGRQTAEGLAPPRPMPPIGTTTLPAGSDGARAVVSLARAPMRSVAETSMVAAPPPAPVPVQPAPPAPDRRGGSVVFLVVGVLVVVGVAAGVTLGVGALLIAFLLAG
ncbi:MAG: serine/threonine protein kinase [Alphaproteobacteria bacterium]|nr:serine/threonine protein kinase [Alphaproteobacteria bacterium]